MLQNQGCSANFVYDAAALAGSADHHRHNGQGLAAGDLDGDGFRDLVTVSNFNIPAAVPLTPRTNVFGSPFDATAFFVPSVIATSDPTRYLWDPSRSRTARSPSSATAAGTATTGPR
ncbi:MAG: hypothetical protein HC897_02130 [Thermoanaerobaculia bacterium]|nr:hypothetical protein [Thermoanaerobaculia bacterium]